MRFQFRIPNSEIRGVEMRLSMETLERQRDAFMRLDNPSIANLPDTRSPKPDTRNPIPNTLNLIPCT
jgi:hypothetical protein